MTQFAWGFSLLRSAFILLTLLFAAYLIWQPEIFANTGEWRDKHIFPSEGSL
jgi:hypothetical protein